MLDGSELDGAEVNGAEVDRIELAPPVTLSGIVPDLLVHCPKLKGKPLPARWLRILGTALLSSGFHLLLCHRLGAFFHRCGLTPLSLLSEKIIYHGYHCIIPSRVRLGPGIWVPHPLGIVLNSNARVGERVVIRQNVEIVQVWAADRDRSGVVGDRAVLNSGCILLKGGVVGHDAVVAARSVVTKPVPPGHLAKGSPAASSPLRDDQRRAVKRLGE